MPWVGRTIGERRERLETKNERAAARKKDKKKATLRIIYTVAGFVALVAILAFLASNFVSVDSSTPATAEPEPTSAEYQPTIEIIDNDATATSGKITARMRTFIGQAEHEFRALGYAPTKAFIPSGSIREVDFYLDSTPGFIKMTIDRGSAVSVEDADRLIRYLAGQGISDFQYLDVRLEGKAYWK